tara:strand:- start:808 stop:1278 length:471 start_codon:yes stop_codon:yes gene_type:complete
MSNLAKHENWMRFAFKEAEKAYQNNEVPIGSIIIKDETIIGRGYNQCEGLNDPTAHAEMIAITSASNTLKSWRLTDCTLYVTKEPCAMCSGALINARVSMVVFGAYDDEEGCCGSFYQLCQEPKFNHQLSIRGGIMEDSCKHILIDFFREKRKSIK